MTADVALKSGWKLVTLGEVATNSTKATKDPEGDGFERYIVGKDIPTDGGRISTWAPVGDGLFGSRIRTIVEEGDVICTTRGPNLRVARSTFRCLSAHTNFVLRSKEEGELLQDYLALVVESDSFQQHLARNFRGSVNLFVNWSDAAKYEFALPPLDEQRRISEVMNSLDEATSSLQEARRHTFSLTESVLSHKCFGLARSSLVPLSSLLDDAFAGAWGSAPGDDEVDALVVRSTEFTSEGCTELGDPAVRSFAPGEVARRRLLPGDILVERSGGTADRPVGRVVLWDSDDLALSSNFVHVLRPADGESSSLLRWMLWFQHRRGSTLPMQTASTNMRNLRIKDFLNQPLPSIPRRQAVQLTQVLDSLAATRDAVTAQLQSSRDLRRSMLAELLRGAGS